MNPEACAETCGEVQTGTWVGWGLDGSHGKGKQD